MSVWPCVHHQCWRRYAQMARMPGELRRMEIVEVAAGSCARNVSMSSRILSSMWVLTNVLRGREGRLACDA